MLLLEIILLALALSIDAAVISFSYGLCTIKNRVRTAVLLAAGVGFFQFFMPLVGGVMARAVFSYIETYAHYVAGAIFIILGVKFLLDAFGEKQTGAKCICTREIILLSLATSIDALAAGSSLYLLKIPIFMPAVIIGVVTFINSVAGFALGVFFKKLAPKPLEITGALVLIAIGVRLVF